MVYYIIIIYTIDYIKKLIKNNLLTFYLILNKKLIKNNLLTFYLILSLTL